MSIFSFICLSTSLLYSGDEPYDFKGIKLGSNISEIINNPHFICEELQIPIGDKMCRIESSEKETIARVPIETIYFFYFNDILSRITVDFNSDYFHKVKTALQVKYGLPKNEKVEMLENRMGALFENHIYEWENSVSIIIAEKYNETIDQSTVMYSLNSYDEEFKKRLKKDAKKGSDDL